MATAPSNVWNCARTHRTHARHLLRHPRSSARKQRTPTSGTLSATQNYQHKGLFPHLSPWPLRLSAEQSTGVADRFRFGFQCCDPILRRGRLVGFHARHSFADSRVDKGPGLSPEQCGRLNSGRGCDLGDRFPTRNRAHTCLRTNCGNDFCLMTSCGSLCLNSHDRGPDTGGQIRWIRHRGPVRRLRHPQRRHRRRPTKRRSRNVRGTRRHPGAHPGPRERGRRPDRPRTVRRSRGSRLIREKGHAERAA